MDLTYRLLNVFTDGRDSFTGNGVAVFEDGSGLTDQQMQALAYQVSVSPVFILPQVDEGNGSDVVVRFFSPEKESTFGGSASLATAAVVRELRGGRGDVRLVEEEVESDNKPTVKERREGREEVERRAATVFQDDDHWVLRAHQLEAQRLKASPQILSSLVGLNMEALAGDAMTIEDGRGGIVLPVRTVEDVRRTRLDARLLHSYAMLLNTDPQVYVWAYSDREEDTIVSRMFYGPRGGVLEVAATGTGAANLGCWLSMHGEREQRLRVIQGRPKGRRSLLSLHIDTNGRVYVGGQVSQIAKGVFTL